MLGGSSPSEKRPKRTRTLSEAVEDLGHAPARFFKWEQLFVEMDELDGDEWKETHRWNFGLEEDLLDDEDGKPVWNHPHLPWYVYPAVCQACAHPISSCMCPRPTADCAPTPIHSIHLP